MYINAHIIEINDSEIRVAKDAQVLIRSPGIAVVNNHDIQLGEPAMKMAYLHPRGTYNRYWNKLNQDALQIPARNYRHHADLAYAHLMNIYEQAGKPDEFMFIVPGSYSNEQLSMLLGIAGACPFTAVGLVDAAVAATASVAGRGKFQHFEIHLHHTVITTLEVTDQVSRTAVETVDETGLNKIYTTIAGVMADLFIQQSRFDPLHHAETEQALYDQLPAGLMVLQDNKEVTLEIHYLDTTHQAKLSRETLLQKLHPVYEKITRYIAPSASCLVGDRLAGLPGMPELFKSAVIIRPEAMFEICQKNEALIRSSGPEISFITALPARKMIREVKQPAGEPELETNPGRDITHILYNDDAYPIGDDVLYLSGSGTISIQKPVDNFCSVSRNNGKINLQVESHTPVLVNSNSIEKTVILKPGDVVQSGTSGVNFRFIRVLQGNGSN